MRRVNIAVQQLVLKMHAISEANQAEPNEMTRKKGPGQLAIYAAIMFILIKRQEAN